MPRRRKPEQPAHEPSTELTAPEPKPAPDDRAFSSRRNVGERDARTDLVPYMALPAETGPLWAPDELSIWPVEGGRFGLDARYLGATVRDEPDGGATLRLGPLAHSAAWVAIEAFLGRPLDQA